MHLCLQLSFIGSQFGFTGRSLVSPVMQTLILLVNHLHLVDCKESGIQGHCIRVCVCVTNPISYSVSSSTSKVQSIAIVPRDSL